MPISAIMPEESTEGGFFSIRLVHAGILMLGAVDFGYSMAFGAAAMEGIRHLSTREPLWASFFEVATSFMAIFGSVLTYFLLKVVRRRLLISIYGGAGTVFWLLLLAALPENGSSSHWFGIVLRGLSGVTVGGLSALLPVFLFDLAPAGHTGSFGTLFQLGVSLGFLLCDAISYHKHGSAKPYRILAGVGAVPTFLVAALVWLIDDAPDAQSEPDIPEIPETMRLPKHRWFFVVCTLLMIFQQTTGVNVVILTMTHFLEKTRGGTGMQVVGCIIGAFLIQKIGRRAVWALSLGVLTIVDGVFAISTVWLAGGNVRNQLSLSGFAIFFMFAYGLGAGPIPWFYVPETFPAPLRTIAMTVITTVNWILAFAVVVLQVTVLREYISNHREGLWGAFLSFEIVSAIGAVSGFYFVRNPEEWVRPLNVLHPDVARWMDNFAWGDKQ
jgi:MFS family permease